MKMFEERLNKLEDGCGWEFKIDGETFFCGDLDYGENPIKHFCDVCDARIEEVKLCQEIQDAREQEILNILKIDNFRMFGFTEEAVNQLCNDDDRTSIIIETLEEVKKKLSQVVGK